MTNIISFEQGISEVYLNISLASSDNCHLVILNASISFIGRSLLLQEQPGITIANMVHCSPEKYPSILTPSFCVHVFMHDQFAT